MVPRESENTKSELRYNLIVQVDFPISFDQINMTLGKLEKYVIGVMAKEHHET